MGAHVFLRPVDARDYELLRAVELSPEPGIRWRWRGATPSPEHWVGRLWDGVLAQFIVVGRKHGQPLGLVMAHRVDFQDGHVYIGALSFGDTRPSPAFVLGVAIFVEYLFSCWNLRKLYLETPEYNLDQFRSGIGTLFEVEARLREHFFLGGRYWDFLTLAMYRRAWEEHGRHLLNVEYPVRTTVRLRFPPPAG